jgi:uncharacterized protein
MEFNNILGRSESPYLQEASHQPVHWQLFTDDVFRLARELDRPILLDIGAVWCHWCHVMDNESYSDAEVAAIINSRFVPVKVDRDQMPDVDARYQTAIGAMTGAGGWPLTGFLTPDGRAFYGGTYFPKNDMQGRPGLMSLLPEIADTYSKRREDVYKSAEEIEQYVKEFESRTAKSGALVEKIIQDIVKFAIEKADNEFGGFGTAPKFFNATALLLLAEEVDKSSDPALRRVVETTLDRIAQGGVYDQLGGGFHRYSVDRYWHVPHFEKMLYDNSLMLVVYLKAFEWSAKELYSETSRRTADWILETMRSPEGPFHAHEDADVGPNDDGSYWTWTEAEVRNSLNEEEFAVIAQYFDIRKSPNDTHELPDRNVLRVAVAPAEIGKELGKPESRITQLIASATRKMNEARSRRKSPFIDKTILADRNGLAISSLTEASLVLKERRYLDAAGKAADYILLKMTDERGRVAHAFAANVVTYDGLLDDQVYFGIALLDLFDVMRNDSHLDAAEKIAQTLLDDFEDKEGGGFFDRPASRKGNGILSSKKKPIDDAPTPSGNSGAAIFLDRLFTITENREYYDAADRTLRAFAGGADSFGIYVSNFGRALRLHLALRKNRK